MLLSFGCYSFSSTARLFCFDLLTVGRLFCHLIFRIVGFAPVSVPSFIQSLQAHEVKISLIAFIILVIDWLKRRQLYFLTVKKWCNFILF